MLTICIISSTIFQLLIIVDGHGAEFGKVVIIALLIVAIIVIAAWNFERQYKLDVRESLKGSATSNSLKVGDEIISKMDIEHLPVPVQKYLKYVGVIGGKKIRSVTASFKGQLREKGKNWFPFTSEQYNFICNPTRLYFLKADFNGLPTRGFHRYKGGEAAMLIKILSIFPIVNVRKPEMFKTETVTFFNDLCLFAPAALIDKNIQWKAIDNLKAKATFSNKGVSISAILYFNEKGQLINFISEDRMDINSHQKIPFSTPIKEYGVINGYKLPIAADAVWHFPEGDFIYGKFRLENLLYNPRD